MVLPVLFATLVMVVILSIVVVDVNTRTWSYCLVFSAISTASSASVCALAGGLEKTVPSLIRTSNLPYFL